MCRLRQKNMATPQKKCSNWVYIIIIFFIFESNGVIFKKVIFYKNLVNVPVATEVNYLMTTRNYIYGPRSDSEDEMSEKSEGEENFE
jgi:hypothetical protein